MVVLTGKPEATYNRRYGNPVGSFAGCLFIYGGYMNKKYKYIIGDVYNIRKLLELYRDDKNILMAKVKCIICGNIKYLKAYELYNKKQNSCMCQTIKHNKTHTKLYSVYHNMKDRCFNKNNHTYHNYGGKNVTICNEWLGEDGFMNFYNWAINSGYKEGLSIDRIDNDGNYDPNNCRWITISENTARSNKNTIRRKANKGKYYGISPDGKFYVFENANKFAKEHNLNGANIRDVANKRKRTHKQWIFGFIQDI